MIKPMRHYCGQVINVEVFQGEEVIAVFFPRSNQDEIIQNCPGCGEELDIDFCGSPWWVDPMPDDVAKYTATHKYCSNCWGFDFEIIPAHNISGEQIGVRVICVNCREDTIGYVSDQFIRREKSDDYIHWRTDIVAICNALGLDLPVFRSEAQNLKELGF